MRFHRACSPPALLLLSLSAAATASASTFPEVKTLENGLQIETLSGPVICDRPTRNHDKLSMHYRGTLQSDGSEFDSSYTHNTPFEFTLGAGEVIKGWDLGLLDMCIGQSRRLTIPSDLAYGNRGHPPVIPPKATLIFETKLLDIIKFSTDPAPSKSEEATMSIATAPPTPVQAQGEEKGGIASEGDAKPAQCHLLGPFALIVQAALGGMAVLSLVYKRWREVPKRPWKIFIFDVSKQVLGSILLHIMNLAMSMLGAIDVGNAAAVVASTTGVPGEPEKTPNPCSYYILNLGIDTTLGVPVLYVLLKLLHAVFLRTSLADPPQSIKSGNYGNPPRVTWYFKQLLIYSIGLTFMKLFVLFLFLALPWLPWVGDWALRWTEGNEALQITFTMFIFPLCMNAVQYWIIDSFIMDKKRDDNDSGQKYVRVGGGDGEGEWVAEDERRRMIDEDDDDDDITDVEDDDADRRRKLAELGDPDEDPTPLQELNPTPIAEGSRPGTREQRKDKLR